MNVQRGVSVDVLPPRSSPSSASQHSLSSTNLPPSFSLLLFHTPYLPQLCPLSPVSAPHAEANFRASSLDSSIQLEVSFHPCSGASLMDVLQWAPQRSSGARKRCAGGEGRWYIGEGGGKSRLVQSSILLTTLSAMVTGIYFFDGWFSLFFVLLFPLFCSPHSLEEWCSPLRSVNSQVIG